LFEETKSDLYRCEAAGPDPLKTQEIAVGDEFKLERRATANTDECG